MPYLGGSAGEVTWDEVKDKPLLFPPESHSHDYKPLAWQPTWLEVIGKPTEFNPSAHQHDYNALLNKPVLFDGSWNSLTGKPDVFPPAVHQHDYNELLNKPVIDSVSWFDLKDRPPEKELNTAIRALTVLQPPKRTTSEINSLQVEAGDFVYDKTLNIYKYWNGSTWKTF